MPADAPGRRRRWQLAALVDRLRAAGCVFAEDEARLLTDQARTPAELVEMVGRRVAGTPLEQVLGWAAFAGLRVAVDPGVFVPRRRTEFLVDQAVAAAARIGRPVIVDLCCGSGAIGAAVLAALPWAEVHAADIDPAAVLCARRNLPAARVYAGDLLDALPAGLRGGIDVLVANAPYVPTDAIATMPPEARDHEPRTALDGGDDGLDVQRRIARAAPDWLAPGGTVLVETSERQAPVMAGIFASAGLAPRIARSAERSATVVIGRQSLPAGGTNVSAAEVAAGLRLPDRLPFGWPGQRVEDGDQGETDEAADETAAETSCRYSRTTH